MMDGFLVQELTRKVDYSGIFCQRFQPLRWITITSGGFPCLESPSLRSPFSLSPALFAQQQSPLPELPTDIPKDAVVRIMLILLYSQKWSTEEFFRESETNMRQGQDLVRTGH